MSSYVRLVNLDNDGEQLNKQSFRKLNCGSPNELKFRFDLGIQGHINIPRTFLKWNLILLNPILNVYYVV